MRLLLRKASRGTTLHFHVHPLAAAREDGKSCTWLKILSRVVLLQKKGREDVGETTRSL